MSSPHDQFAKHVFRRPHRAAEEFRHVVGPSLASRIAWKSIRSEPSELADEELESRFPDLRFSGRFLEGGVHFNFVCEHQSTIDPLMPARFACHMGAIWNQTRQDQQGKMPLVLNIVLHTGPSPWITPLDLASVIAGGEYLKVAVPNLLPTLPVLIDDLAQVSDDEVIARRQSAEVRLSLLALKHGRKGETIPMLRKAEQLVQRVPEQALGDVLRYAVTVDVEAALPEVGRALVGPLGKKRGMQMAMTVGDRLMAEGEARALLSILRARGLRLTASQRALIKKCSDAEQMHRWVESALKGEPVSAIFASKSKGATKPQTRH